MWPDTQPIDLLEIEHPILLAPMGGETTPAMVIAVSNAAGIDAIIAQGWDAGGHRGAQSRTLLQ